MSLKTILAGALFGCVVLSLPSTTVSARPGAIWESIHFGYDGSDTPGAPRAPEMIERALLLEGYELREPIVRDGPDDFAVVQRANRPYCLMLDSFNGTVLQRFRITPAGLRPEIDDAPGPGFPGYPPFSDGRYATACHVEAIALVPTEPPAKPAPRHTISAPRRRSRLSSACGPSAPAKASSVAPTKKRRASFEPKASGQFCPKAPG